MPYVRVPNPRFDVDKPARSVDMKQLRDNQDFFDTQISDLQISGGFQTDQDIRDHFLGATIDTTRNWVQATGASGIITLGGDHKVLFDSIGTTVGNFAVMEAHADKLTIDKTMELVATMRVRVKELELGPAWASYFLGWQDQAIVLGGLSVSDTSDCVGIVHEGSSQSWQARTSNGGTPSTANLGGTSSNYEELLVLFTCSATAGNRKVEFYRDGVLQITLNTDANMPTATLIPTIGVRADASDPASIDLDFAEFGFQTAPLEA